MPCKDSDKLRQQRQKYYKNHKEEIKEKSKQYRDSHKEQKRQYNIQYQQNNKEQIKVQRKQYFENNKEQIRQKNLEYYRLNRDKRIKKNKEWVSQNKEKKVIMDKQYRQDHPEVNLKAKIKQLTKLGTSLNLSSWETRTGLISWSKTVRKKQGDRCLICGSSDHVNSHHILYKNKYPELSLNENNGIPLCRLHHLEVHRLN